jgi:hypothetical protein
MFKIIATEKIPENPCVTCPWSNEPHCERDCYELHKYEGVQSILSLAKEVDLDKLLKMYNSAPDTIYKNYGMTQAIANKGKFSDFVEQFIQEQMEGKS